MFSRRLTRHACEAELFCNLDLFWVGRSTISNVSSNRIQRRPTRSSQSGENCLASDDRKLRVRCLLFPLVLYDPRVHPHAFVRQKENT